MSPRREKSLATTMFASVLAYTVAIVGCFVIVFSATFYGAVEKEAESRLLSVARTIAATLDADPGNETALLEAQLPSGLRYTLIEPDGSVDFDSRGDTLGNHNDRPEVQEARNNGSGSVARHSQTLDEDTLYAAVALDSGAVVRVAEKRPSPFAVLEAIAGPMAAAIALAALLSVALSRVLARRIVSPLDAVDVADPLGGTVYKETLPLLSRIHDQQRQLVDQNRELTRAEGMRREFSANVSHEMKTPLQVIAGYAELMAAGTVPSEDVQRFSEIITQEAANMTALIDDVLVLSRLDDPVTEGTLTEPVELLSLAKETIDRLQPLARARDVELCAYGSTAELLGNKGLLMQITVNLVSNAIRYSSPGGRVTVTTGKNVIAEAGASGPEAFVRVKDNGCGIAPEEQEKIFERFYRVDKSRSKESGGTGLGLAIAKHAALFHDARIVVDSAPGQGSTFTVFFAVDDPARNAAASLG